MYISASVNFKKKIFVTEERAVKSHRIMKMLSD